MLRTKCVSFSQLSSSPPPFQPSDNQYSCLFSIDTRIITIISAVMGCRFSNMQPIFVSENKHKNIYFYHGINTELWPSLVLAS